MVKHKQFIGCRRRIVWVCLTILWGWRLKGAERLTSAALEGIITIA